MNTRFRGIFGRAMRIGLLAGAIAVFLCLVGIVEVFGGRSLVEGVISLGQIFLYLPLLAAGYLALIVAAVAGFYSLREVAILWR